MLDIIIFDETLIQDKMKKNRIVTDFLFSTPTFLSGAATVLNIFGNFYEYNTSSSEREADATALNQDFKMVGQDISDAIGMANSDNLLCETLVK